MECLLHFSAPTASSVPTLFQADKRSTAPARGKTQANGSLGKRTAKQQPAGAPRAQTTVKAWDAIRSILLWVCKTVFCMDCREIEAGMVADKLDRLLQKPGEIINQEKEISSLHSRLGTLGYKINPQGVKEIVSCFSVEDCKLLSTRLEEERLGWFAEILNAKIGEEKPLSSTIPGIDKAEPRAATRSETSVMQSPKKISMQGAGASREVSRSVNDVLSALSSLDIKSREADFERAAFALMKLSFMLSADTPLETIQTQMAEGFEKLNDEKRGRLKALSSSSDEDKAILTDSDGRSSVMMKINHDALVKAGKNMVLSEQNKNIDHVQKNVGHILDAIIPRNVKEEMFRGS